MITCLCPCKSSGCRLLDYLYFAVCATHTFKGVNLKSPDKKLQMSEWLQQHRLWWILSWLTGRNIVHDVLFGSAVQHVTFC